MNRIEWTQRAAKQLRKLPHPAQVDIRDAVQDKLPHFPSCSGVKALVNHAHGYRLRVGIAGCCSISKVRSSWFASKR